MAKTFTLLRKRQQKFKEDVLGWLSWDSNESGNRNHPI